MDSVFDIICALSEHPAISGKESPFPHLISDLCHDEIGNVWWKIQGKGEHPKTILIEAHRDEIGLCISNITKEGFLSVNPCGGIDVATLPGQVFTVVGRKNIQAIATSTPPHLKNQAKKNDKLTFDDLYLDTGITSVNELKKNVSIGDVAYPLSLPKKLSGGAIAARGLDNKASVAALLLAFEMIKDPENTILFLLSVGEETTSCGVRSFCRRFKPDIALVVDAGFALAPGLEKSRCIQAGLGPSVSVTDTLSIAATRFVQQIAMEKKIPFQVIAEPGGTGTSATAIQKENGGIPAAVISIPVFNMHTQSEIVSDEDIQKTAKLLSALAQTRDLPRKEVILLDRA